MFLLTCVHSYHSYYKNYQQFEHYFSALIILLIFFCQNPQRLVPFHVPIVLSLHIPLGAVLWPWWLEAACNYLWNFIFGIITFPHHLCFITYHCVSTMSLSKAVHSKVRQFLQHSHHGYFIEDRPIMNRASSLHFRQASSSSFNFQSYFVFF